VADAGRAEARSREYREPAGDPLAVWTEDTFGLDSERGTGRLVRRKPTTVILAAEQLAQETGLDETACAAATRGVLLGAQACHPAAGRPLFAFRLHQFLSKGDIVYVSLEPEHLRHITGAYQLRVPGEPGKALLPLGFCRECGQEYRGRSRRLAVAAQVLGLRDRRRPPGHVGSGKSHDRGGSMVREPSRPGIAGRVVVGGPAIRRARPDRMRAARAAPPRAAPAPRLTPIVGA
jgi:hypothetical protein